jgi:hypothetical protein
VIKRRFLLLLTLLLFCQGGSLVFSQTIDHDGVRITAVPDLPPKSFFGHSFYRVLITNSSNYEREIRLLMRAQYSSGLQEVARKFSVAAGEMREESLNIPNIDFSSSGMRVEIDGQMLSDQLTRDFRIYRNHYDAKQILVDSRISRTEFTASFDPSGSGHGRDVEMNQFEGSVDQLYQNWLGYSQYSLLVFYASTVESMPEAVKRAIFDYVRAGGCLLTIGVIELPEDFTESSARRHASTMNMRVFESNFGRVFCGEDSLLRELASNAGRSLPYNMSELFTRGQFHGESPLRFSNDETDTVSTRWLMVVVYLFAFLIGPVNVFVLHRLGKKILVFLTVPLASGLCCLFIYAYYLVFESSLLMVKKQSLTILDETFNRAVTLANYSLYSSSSYPEGLHFDRQTEVYPYGQFGSRGRDSGRFINLDEDMHLASGWIRPKVPCALHLRSVQTRRERISVSMQNGVMQVLNGLGSDIESVRVATRDGMVFSGTAIAAGKQAVLQPTSVKIGGVKRAVGADLFDDPWFNSISDLNRSPDHYLQPGSYIAKIKRSPFLSQQLDNSAEVDEESYVVGIFKTEEQT